jgi:hypothetical protein
MANKAVATDLLEAGQLVAVALQFGVVGVEVLNPSCLGGRRCFAIATKGFNMPPVWDYEDEGLLWSRDASKESRDALFAASQLARSAA